MKRRIESGAALIVVIFVIMLFGILGWALAVMQAGMFESAVRAIAPDQALNLAEAGARWGLNAYVADGTMTSSDDACDSSSEWVTHSLAPGQYQVCSRLPQSDETGSVVVESIGYVPTVASYQSKRRVKIMASVGSFEKSMIGKSIFNWTDADKSNSYVNGSMICVAYEANGNHVYNEEGIDYSNTATDLLPKTNRSSGRPSRPATPVRRDVGISSFPEIDLSFYETDPQATILAPAMTSTISQVTHGASTTTITLSQANFFSAPLSQWTGNAMRNISRGTWKDGTWKQIQSVTANTATLTGLVDWAVNDRVTLIPKITTDPAFNAGQRTYTFTFNGTVSWPVGQAVRNFSKGTWQYSDWGVIKALSSASNKTTVTLTMDSSVSTKTWQLGDLIGCVRRFTVDDTDIWNWDTWDSGLLFNRKLVYVESDVLFDARTDDINTYRTGVVFEGDAAIRGTRGISLQKKPLLYPNLATKNGNIYSPDQPQGNNINQRLSKRNFDDIIFTQNGDIYFNYVDCMAMYGGNITLAGVFYMNYDPQLTRLGGYAFGLSGSDWQEE